MHPENSLFDSPKNPQMKAKTNQPQNFDLTSLKKIEILGNQSPSASPPRKPYILPLARKFVDRLKTAIFFSRITSLSIQGRKIINDLSDVQDPYVSIPKWIKNKSMRIIYKKTKMFFLMLHKMPVLTPYDNVKFIFDLIHFLVIFFLIFWIPIETCFDTYLPSGANQFFLVLFIVDAFLNMNTAYYHKGFIVKNRTLIYIEYVRNFLFWDLFSLVGFGLDHPINGSNNRGFSNNIYVTLKLIFLLRFRNFVSLYTKFIERINAKFVIKDSLIDFNNLIFFSVYILHIFACFWYFIAAVNFSDPNIETWVNKLDLLDETVEAKYMYSLYWSSVTIMTVGYGDISPQNAGEVWFTIVAIFFGCGVVAYIISAIGNIMIDLTKEDQIFKYFFSFVSYLYLNHFFLIFRQNIYIMNKFMRRKKITPNLQMKIRQYLRFIWQEELTQNVEFENSTIEKLSKSLKEELFLEANGSILNKYSMFFANYSETMLRALMHKMKEVRFNPEDLIFSQNTLDDSEIYFIIKGKVEIFVDTQKRVGNKNHRQSLQNLTEGDVFGELSFFTGQPRTASAKSKDFSSMVFIKREDLLNILQKFPEDYEKYCLMREQIMTERNLNSLNTSCYSCKGFDHLIKDCPLFHYKFKSHHPCLTDQIQKSRKTLYRRNFKTGNALCLLSITKAKTEKFRSISKNRKSMNLDEFDEEEKNNHNNLDQYEFVSSNDSHLLKSIENNQILSRNNESNEVINSQYTDKSQILNSNDYKIKQYYNPVINSQNENERMEAIIAMENNAIVNFDKVGHFKIYHPNSNFKQFICNLKIKKNEIQKAVDRRNKFQVYFSKKIHTGSNANFAGIRLSRKSNSNIFSENQLNYDYFGKKKRIDFFDIVFEVITNQDLRKKLFLIKNKKEKKKMGSQYK